MKLEYEQLMESLFDNAAKHIKVIEILAAYPKGLQRDALLKKSKLQSGGGFTTILDELEHSGFINTIIPFGKNINEKIYQLTDLYTLFYLKYIAIPSAKKVSNWLQLFNTTTVNNWCGYAFEYVCMAHINQINKALKIDGIGTQASAWQTAATDAIKGAQIDIVIDRQDAIINICEIKFKEDPYIITADYAQKLRNKLAAFKHIENTKKSLFLTFITPYGITENKYSKGFVQNTVTLSHLFLE